MLIGPLLTLALALAQSRVGAPDNRIEEGQKAYAEHCAACHGSGFEGTDQGPKLAGNRRVGSRSVKQLHTLVEEGRPSSGMPAFPLPTAELDALATFVHSLNSPAAEAALPGVVSAGDQFFFGKGQCASCHMVQGRGKPIGPDLSNVARELTVSEITQSLLKPGAHIAPGYGLVTVRLRDGT